MLNTSQLTLNRITYWWFSLAAFLLPFLAIPGLGLPLELPKRFFFALAVILTLTLCLLVSIERGRFVIPRHPLCLGVLAVLVVFFLTSLLSSPHLISFTGLALESGTFLGLFFFFLSLFLAAALFNSESRITAFYASTLISFLILFLFQVVYWIWPPLGRVFNLQSGADTLLGKWNDFAVFAGFIIVVSLALLQFNLSVSRRTRTIAAITLPAALIVLVLARFAAVWWTVAGVTIIILLLTFLQGKRGRAWLGLGVLILVSLLAVSHSFAPLQEFLDQTEQRLNLTNWEVRPSLKATFLIARDVLREQPLWGAGLNKFGVAWSKFKPAAEINNTPFWDTDFQFGFSWLPTLIITGGALVGLAMAFFLLSFLYFSLRAAIGRATDPAAASLVFLAAAAFIYLWSVTFFYVSETVVLAFTFLVSGVLLAALMLFAKTAVYSLNLPGSPGGVAVRLVAAVAVVVLAGFSIYGLSTKFFSWHYYAKGLKIWETEQNLETAEGLLRQALRFAPHDLFHLSLAEVQLVKIKETKDLSVLQTVAQEAIAFVQEAVRLNPDNYRNWLVFAKVYATLDALGVSGAAEEASRALSRAQSLNPQNPRPDLELAKLELGQKRPAEAREHLNRALEKKADFVPALSLLVQLEQESGGQARAITRLAEAIKFNPNDLGLWFELGYFLYEAQQFERASAAFLKALELNPNHSDSLYFLGWSYTKLGRFSEALKVFKNLQLLNPGRADLQSIIAALEAGHEP